MTTRLRITLLSWCVGFVPLAAQADVPHFCTEPLDALRAAAATARRAIVIDLSSDACEPCRRLLQTTWRDEPLWQWLDQHAHVVRIDPEQDRKVAEEFAPLAYPTMVVLGKDGREVGRIVGYVDAATLRQKLDELIVPFPTDWRERKALADRLRKSGEHAAALEHYLWLWDHGEEHNRGFGGVRVSFFLGELVRFAEKYEPMRTALEQRRDAIERDVLAGTIDYAPVRDMVRLNEVLEARDRSFAVFEQVAAAKWEGEAVARRVLVRSVAEFLLGQRRYADAVRVLGDPVAALDEELRTFEGVPLPPDTKQQMLRTILLRQGAVLEAYFGARDDAWATKLVDRLLELDGRVETWLMVLRAARRAGHDVACHDFAVRALQELPEQDREQVREFLQKK